MFFLLFMLEDRRIRIRDAQKRIRICNTGFFQATVQLSQSLPPNFGRFTALEDFKSKMAAFQSPGAGCPPPPNGAAGSQEWSNSLVKSTNTFRLGFIFS